VNLRSKDLNKRRKDSNDNGNDNTDHEQDNETKQKILGAPRKAVTHSKTWCESGQASTKQLQQQRGQQNPDANSSGNHRQRIVPAHPAVQALRTLQYTHYAPCSALSTSW